MHAVARLICTLRCVAACCMLPLYVDSAYSDRSVFGFRCLMKCVVIRGLLIADLVFNKVTGNAYKKSPLKFDYLSNYLAVFAHIWGNYSHIAPLPKSKVSTSQNQYKKKFNFRAPSLATTTTSCPAGWMGWAAKSIILIHSPGSNSSHT